MLIEFGADLIPVVFLTTDTVDTTSEDAVVVEGQEGLEEEAVMEDDTVEEGSDVVASDASGEESDATESGEGTEALEGETTEGEELEGESVEGETVEGEVLEGEEAVSDDGVESEDISSEEMLGGSMSLAGETVADTKDPLLSSPFFVGGISLAVLVVGGVLGFFLAKKKIKKGIELYEDI